MSKLTSSVELRGEGVLADPLVQELLAARSVGVLATLEPDASVTPSQCGLPFLPS